MGLWGNHTSLFLTALGILILVAFGVPMALWPLKWARALRWRLPDHTDLAVYFGRSLGSVAVVIGAFSIAAGQMPAVQPLWLGFFLAIALLMVAVHAYGAFRRIQPWTETWEILFWAGLVAVTILCWPINGS